MKETVNTKMENLQWEIMYGKMFLRPEVLANKMEEADRLRYIRKLWLDFCSVPVDPESECLENEWHGFPEGTHREVIWRWFEAYFHISVTELMCDAPQKIVTLNDMIDYGYTWLGMVPMHARQALRLFESENYCIYKLYQNNTKSEVIFDGDIEEGYLYGVEYNRKDAYEWLMSVLDEDGPLVWKEGQKIYCKNVELQNQVVEYLKSKDYSVSQDCKIVKQEDMICGFAINRTYYYVTVSDSINNNLSCQKYKDVPKAEVDEIEEESFENDTILWNELKKHRGHKISIVSYGDWEDPTDICLECEDCGKIILDAEIYTLCARENC